MRAQNHPGMKSAPGNFLAICACIERNIRFGVRAEKLRRIRLDYRRGGSRCPLLATSMRTTAFITGYCILLLASSSHAAGREHVELKNGNVIEADVLKKTPDHVYIDLGFDILSIPRAEVSDIREPGPVPAGAVASGAPVHSADLLYSVRPDGKEVSVPENARRLGESVVQIRTASGLGSGFIIHPSGYVVSNHHVIAGEHGIAVTIYRQKEGELEKVRHDNVKIVATCPQFDLALLKIESGKDGKFPSAPLGIGDDVRQGETVFAIGSPLGLERSVSQGIVSLKNRVMGGLVYIQTTTQINPGNSGGPLFNLRGEVIGVTSQKMAAVGIEGVGFAIPSSLLRFFLANRDAYAFDPRNPNSGYRYVSPAKSSRPGKRPDKKMVRNATEE